MAKERKNERHAYVVYYGIDLQNIFVGKFIKVIL